MKELFLMNHAIEYEDSQSDEDNNLSYLMIGVEFNYNNYSYRIDKVNLEENQIKAYKYADNESCAFNNFNEINSLIECCFNN